MKKHIFTKVFLSFLGFALLAHYLFLAVVEVPDLRETATMQYEILQTMAEYSDDLELAYSKSLDISRAYSSEDYETSKKLLDELKPIDERLKSVRAPMLEKMKEFSSNE